MSRRDSWNERYAAKDLIWSAGPNTLFAETVRSLTPGCAIDAACGEGRNALWLAEQGWTVSAIDFSEVAIDKARRIAAARELSVDWVVADLTEHRLAPDSADLVAVLYLHTNPAERAIWLPLLVAAVRRGGSFLYIGHDPGNIKYGTGGPQKEELLPGADELREALPGFRIRKAEVVSRALECDPGHMGSNQTDSGQRESDGQVALDTFVHAERL